MHQNRKHAHTSDQPDPGSPLTIRGSVPGEMQTLHPPQCAVNIYLHRGDLTLEPPDEPLDYFRYAQAIGVKTKTVTSGINPRGLEMFLPYLSRLALSVDALDKPTYVKLRKPRNYTGLIETLELLKGYHKSGSEIFMTALVIVNRQMIGNI